MTKAEKKYLLDNVIALENVLDYIKRKVKAGKITGDNIDGVYSTWVDYHIAVLKRDIT